MLTTKMIEVRDRATTIVVMCIKMKSMADDLAQKSFSLIENKMIRYAGFSEDGYDVFLCDISNGKGTYDPFKYSDYSRTLLNAHLYIRDHWDELKSGDVVDVEYILGESDSPKNHETY